MSKKPTPGVLDQLERAALASLAKKAAEGSTSAAKALLLRVDKIRKAEPAPVVLHIAPDEDTSQREEILEWMKTEAKGYKAASKKFGIPRETIRRWKSGTTQLTAAPALAPTHARDIAAAGKVKLDPLAWRRDMLADLHVVWKTEGTSKRPSATGMAALVKSMATLRGEIDELAEAAGDEYADMTPDEVRDYLGTLYEDYADEHLELAFLVYAERHGGRVVFVADGGKRTEFDGVDGWRDVALDG